MFSLDPAALASLLERARRRAEDHDVGDLLTRARDGSGLEPEDMAALWYAPAVSTRDLLDAAEALRREQPVTLETFSPLYVTNTCDAECKMCGMRKSNDKLDRQSVDIETVEDQLRTLRHRGMRAVALLTGEYRAGRRLEALRFVNRALRLTQELGFLHVLVNVGSIDETEYDALFDGIERTVDGALAPKITMCTFQETYSRDAYAKFMGTDPGNPRADFERRLANFDRAFDAGMRVANPGILLGLNPDVGEDLVALATHTRHLLDRGMEVYLSVPRLRQTAGGKSLRGIDDDAFLRAVALLTIALPEGKTVVTTRESAEVQRSLASIITVISSGSSAVAPYTEDGARFPLEASQFEVVDQRPFERVLEDYADRGPIMNFEPARDAGTPRRPHAPAR